MEGTLFIILTCLAYSESSSPKISPFSFPHDLDVGMRTSVVCSVKFGDTPLSFKWYKDGQLVINEKSMVTRTMDEYTSTLAIQKLDSGSNGNYTCKVTNLHGEDEKSAFLSVKETPDPMLNPAMFQGDLLNGREPDDRNAVPFDSMRWPGGEIHYVIDDALDSEARASIDEAMAHISSETCIRFVERRREKDYVNIFKGSGCYSHWGRIGGEQKLSLGNGCYHLGTVVHELMHAVGFEHEHNREDRDDYLKIFWENIDEGYEDAFDSLLPNEERLLTDFDFNSVMLYGSHAFSKDPGLMTMTALSGSPLPEVKDKSGLSTDDIKRVQMLYDC